MTPAACEFVTPLTFQALSGNPVVTGMWGDQRPGSELPDPATGKLSGKVEHVDVAEVAECLVLAPPTASLMARLVHGLAPDALTRARAAQHPGSRVSGLGALDRDIEPIGTSSGARADPD